MKKLYWISLLLIITVIGTSTFFARRYYTAKRPVSIEDRIEILNETTAIRVISKKIDKEALHVEMQNAGDQPILAYRLDLHNEDKFVIDYSVGEPLAPTRKTTAVIPLKNLIKNEKELKKIIRLTDESSISSEYIFLGGNNTSRNGCTVFI